MLLYLQLFILLFSSLSECKVVKQSVRSIPEGLLLGAATASFVLEGAWDADGKSESIWDHMIITNQSDLFDGTYAWTAADSYYQYERDVEMMRELGLDYYRFSISWPRLLPSSFPDQINEAGVTYYNNLINEMLKYNIVPMITLYHWDLPQRLQELGGWVNPYIVDWFADYARVAFELFGDRVKHWMTVNEPREICYQGYGDITLPPMVNMTGIADYVCAKNLLLAHAKAYHIYNDEFRPKQNGNIFIVISASWIEPHTENDIVAAEEAHQFEWGIYAHPIFSETGDFPPVVKERIAAKSAEQGYFRSRLPEFTPEEVEYVKGTSDFFGLNTYTTEVVYRNESTVGQHRVPSFYDDLDVLYYETTEWESTASDWFKVVPWGFYKLLMKIKEDYNCPIFVTENGYSSYGGLEDDDRISYLRRYLDAMLDAMEDGADVRGYTHWCLMDTSPWIIDNSELFGLYEVDYVNPPRTRTPRKSAFVYKEIIRSRSLDWDYEPDTREMTID